MCRLVINLFTHTCRYTMVWAMGSMSVAHLYRIATDYGGWSLDFTGPLMLMVQKVTLVAYALHDGETIVTVSLKYDLMCNLKSPIIGM